MAAAMKMSMATDARRAEDSEDTQRSDADHGDGQACTRTDAQQVLAPLADDALTVDDLITHRYPLTAAAEAVDALQSRTEPIWMAVVNP